MTPHLSQAQTDVLSLQHLNFFLRQVAERLSDLRKLRHLLREHERQLQHLRDLASTQQDMIDDWNHACSFLGLKIVDGTEVQFAQLDTACFPLLQQIWLCDVKRLKAYYIWEACDTGTAEGNYFKASQEIRQSLCRKKQESPEVFERVKDYFETSFLSGGSIDERKAGLRDVINRKAYRIWQNTDNPDSWINWFRAKLYVRMFYEDIIPAVAKSDKAATLAVLKAFQFSKSSANRYFIISCFEAIVAICFLNKDIVREILQSPESYDYSIVPVDDWPKDIGIPVGRIRYDSENRHLVCEGVMTPEDKAGLISRFKEPRQKCAIEHLFQQSHVAPCEETIL